MSSKRRNIETPKRRKAETRTGRQANAAAPALGRPQGRGSRQAIPAPPTGRIVTPDSALDGYLEMLTDGLTFDRLRSRINAALRGDLSQGLELFEEMEAKDSRLRSVSAVRRRSLTGLPWEVVSAADVTEDIQDKGLADAAADFIRDEFANLRNLRRALQHLSTGIGPNLAVLEMVWEARDGGSSLIDLQPVWGTRLIMDPREPGLIRVITSDDREGQPATAPKFVVHMPEGQALFPFRRSLFRAQAVIWLAKMLAFADWKVFCEVFGMPVRIGTYRNTASADEKSQLIDMLKNLGSKAWGAFSEAVNLQLLESSQRGTSPYKDFIDLCNRETGILWLGSNVTGETTGGLGTSGQAIVKDEVKDDLREEDIETEGETVRGQIVPPMCLCEFWRDDVPLPYFRRKKPETIDRSQEADVIRKAQGAGLQVPRAWAHKRIGIPEPQEGDDVLEPVDAFTAGVTEGNPEEATA